MDGTGQFEDPAVDGEVVDHQVGEVVDELWGREDVCPVGRNGDLQGGDGMRVHTLQNIHTCTHTYTYMYMYMNICMYVYMHVQTTTTKNMYMNIHVCTCMHVHVCTQMYVHNYVLYVLSTCTCMYVLTYSACM